ncbi:MULTISPECIES: DUF6596 domain-containing protein [unclassified Brevibacterium]|uniref:RNA polymerase sigma factor n=1 Tax=unclassified Brevibacterium TaxID=2614124 RepID=UPI001E4673C3|nr:MULTISPECIES: DUF6596 domain-containing protein [unclassified Brevibacterium]MCD1287770.1 hypothetical protein [Brevibacterium sp. CCUG 69071]MDK8435121.1 sigma factor [Brevibacterium sp. H-BE7]
MTDPTSEDVLRLETPHVLAALVRRFGDFASCEDAVQEALLDASQQWPMDGIPDRPRGWLLRVASRRLVDSWRQDGSRREREHRFVEETARSGVAEVPNSALVDQDASLEVLALCCHPALTTESQVTLALRAVLGLSTKQIAAVFLIPDATAGQRISRAKATIDEHHRRFPSPASMADRLPAILHALYLLFTTGHSLPEGDDVSDSAISSEALRLAHLLHDELPAEGEVAGLLALLLLSNARRPARTSSGGDLVRLKDQDRRLWDHAAVAEGIALLERALPVGPVGAYQLQAAISAVHAEADTWEETDWPQIAELYSMLSRVSPSPTVTMNYAVALNEVDGPKVALRMLEPLLDDKRMSRSHRLHAARAPMLEKLGNREKALEAYRTASRLCTNIPEQRYLNAQIVRLGNGIAPDDR